MQGNPAVSNSVSCLCTCMQHMYVTNHKLSMSTMITQRTNHHHHRTGGRLCREATSGTSSTLGQCLRNTCCAPGSTSHCKITSWPACGGDGQHMRDQHSCMHTNHLAGGPCASHVLCIAHPTCSKPRSRPPQPVNRLANFITMTRASHKCCCLMSRFLQ